MKTQFPDRRKFLAASSSTLAAACLSSATSARGDDAPSSRYPVCVFTKPFNSLSFEKLAASVAELGFDGIEAPIRKNGHIEATDVKQKLPQLVDALGKEGLTITVMTSDINDADHADTNKILSVAADLGIQRYRLGYLRYQRNQSIQEQLDQWRGQLTKLAALNAKLGIRGVYQNHAGNYALGAPIWDLRYVLQDIDPKQLGVAYDIRHATVEGGQSWPLTFNMIRPHIDMVYVKDFAWNDDKVENVPLGQGRVDPKFFAMLKESGFVGPVSLHEEYIDHRDPALVPDHLAAMKSDLATLKGWMTELT